MKRSAMSEVMKSDRLKSLWSEIGQTSVDQLAQSKEDELALQAFAVLMGRYHDIEMNLPKKLSRRDILSTLRKNQRSVNKCKAHVKEKTKVNVRIVIESSGKVSKASVLEPAAVKGTPLETCMVGRVKQFVFPKFNGKSMSIKMPFLL